MNEIESSLQNNYEVLNRSFFNKDSIETAKSLLGCILISQKENKATAGRIVETEAYPGDDPASHVYGREITDRTKYQLLDGGHLYLYLIHGKYVMTSIVVNKENIPDVVFIRAVEPIYGEETMFMRREMKNKDYGNLSNGPGKLSSCFNITMEDQGKDLLDKNTGIYIARDLSFTKFPISSGKRINLGVHGKTKEEADRAINQDWRFYIEKNPFLSK